ncbi:hypothetical protein [Streptomyces sp. NPDC002133]|uniref:hypothetical protein n=1 Tax=Streptomyces sp. NPDC002133 TaxID=3154409 RepID=UPI00331F621E
MPNEPDNTKPQDQYTAQIAAVLETNTQEQERVRSQMADLQARLERLQHDHKLLSEMCGTKGVGAPETPVKERAAKSASGEADATSGEAAAPQAVPKPRSAKAKKAAAAPRRQQENATQSQSKPRGAAKPQKAAAKKTRPALHELVQGLLTSDPKTAGELVTALAEAHPKRAVTNTQLVRNALNTLIRNSRAERHQQGTAVFFTAPENDTATVSVPGPAAESAPTEEKVAAEV